MIAPAHNRQSQSAGWLILALMIALHIGLWFSVRGTKPRWANVPPPPSANAAAAMSLGDRALAYRSAGITLQNLGSTGGDIEPLRTYDYSRLGDWMFMTRDLDPHSNFVPFLAAYYFSGVDDPEKARQLIPYLVAQADDPTGQKWRWMAQAVFIAHHQVHDLDLAYKLATQLAALPDPTLPIWAKQMPAFILASKGDRREAYDIMVQILKTTAGKVPVQEVNFMKDYICTRVLTPEEAKTDPLCRPG